MYIFQFFHLWNGNNDKGFLRGLYFGKIYLKVVSKGRICFPPASSITHPHPGLYYIILGGTVILGFPPLELLAAFYSLSCSATFWELAVMAPQLLAFTPLPPGDRALSDVLFHPWVILGAMVSRGGRSECWKNRPDHRPCRNAWGCDLRHLAG